MLAKEAKGKDAMLKKGDIKRLLAKSETDAVEFKLAKGGVPASFWESYSAFANTDGGVIILGVKEDGGKHSVVGVTNANKLVADVWNAANNPQRVSANVLFNHQVYKVDYQGKALVVVEVPRAERTERPVYVGRDVFRGTFRRNGEGDYHCSQEAVEAMIRDKCPETADCCLLEDMTIGDLNQESISRYRLMFGQSKPEHAWTRIPDDEFMVKIGAARKDAKGVVRPMLAGLICFGDFVTISNVLPNYFLDYREGVADGSRWTDRVAAHDATWSGNIIDFYFRIYDKVTSSVKVPFRLDERGLRINETKVHKALRELLANALIHADYHGRQGIVIEKRFRRLMFRNPGCLRMSKEAAIGGGRSDARNSRIFNIFALINIGERSGTGLSDIYSIWKEYGYEEPTITETYQPDQTTVTVQVELEEGAATTQESVDTTQESMGAPQENAGDPQESAVKTANVAVKDAVTTQEDAVKDAVTIQEVAPKTGEVALKVAPKNGGVALKVAPKTGDVAPNVAPKDGEATPQKGEQEVCQAVNAAFPMLRDGIAEKCAKMYVHMRDSGGSNSSLARELDIPLRSIIRYQEILKQAHVLEHVGPANGGVWKFLI